MAAPPGAFFMAWDSLSYDIKKALEKIKGFIQLPAGLEPATYALRMLRSTN